MPEVPLSPVRLQHYEQGTTDECMAPQIRPYTRGFVRQKFGNRDES